MKNECHMTREASKGLEKGKNISSSGNQHEERSSGGRDLIQGSHQKPVWLSVEKGVNALKMPTSCMPISSCQGFYA